VADLEQKPFPPGRYRLIVVGSGPGALQFSYCLGRLGIEHAVLSEDPGPGGMFRRWPVFQRMLSWTKPHSGFDHSSRTYELYDWNSLLADELEQRAVMPRIMDGSSYFPSRPEMEKGLIEFVLQAGLRIRFGCRWQETSRGDGEFRLATSDGEYHAPCLVFAVGVAEPWRPPIPGLEVVPHYGEMRPVETYRDRRVFIIGKQNSGFEIATGLLPWARRIVLASPSPTRLSVNTHSLVGVRARYVQPYEDSVLSGGVVVLDASIEEVKRIGDANQVLTRSARDGGALTFEVDDVIAATGFVAPLRDLPQMGVATFGQSRLPAQTPFWESATVPGIFFAGTLSQGSRGLMKHGIPSNSGAVQGHRYNARLLAHHLAETRFGKQLPRRRLDASQVVSYVLSEAARGPELWHQRSYLARVVILDADGGISDDGIVPLAHFLDTAGPNAVAVALESNGRDEPYPAVYVRRNSAVTEHLLPPHPLLDFDRPEYRQELAAALEGVLSPSTSRALP
jgi:thioredoxin reductase